jgi:hypothetical protein
MQTHKGYEKNQGNMTSPKANNPTVTDMKDSEKEENSRQRM